MPWSADAVTSVVNVNWGPNDVIVVFAGVYVYNREPGPPLTATYVLIGEGVEFLQSWLTPIVEEEEEHPGFRTFAFKTKLDAAEFIELRSPVLHEDVNGFWFDVLVFAMQDGNDDESLARAVAGTKDFLPEYYKDSLGASHPLPGRIDPPGLLWGVQTGATNSGQFMTFKMRFGNHRPDDDHSLLPNAMVQCYPLGPPFSGWFGDVKVTYTGYFLHLYRLDNEGTGPVYSLTTLDPAWGQPIVVGPEFTSGIKGIPFADPPPLVSSDPP